MKKAFYAVVIRVANGLLRVAGVRERKVVA
jgi:hypothetical protein